MLQFFETWPASIRLLSKNMENKKKNSTFLRYVKMLKREHLFIIWIDETDIPKYWSSI